MKRPSVGATVLGLIPFVAACFSVSLWDRIHPTIFGLPFNFFWLILWALLTPPFLWASYLVDPPDDGAGSRDQDDQK